MKISESKVLKIEMIERDAWLDVFSAETSESISVMNIRSMHFDSGMLIAAPTISKSVFNRYQCVGVLDAVTQSSLDDAIEWMRCYCSPFWAIEIVPGALPPLPEDWLRRRGLAKDRSGIVKFWRGPVPINDPPPVAFEIRQLRMGEGKDFGLVAQAAFGLPFESVLWLASLAGRPGWRVYVAYDGSTPMGCGALFHKNGWAWIGFGATLPNYRRRGVQRALINRRIADGIAQGVEAFTCDTGQPLDEAGAAASSYRNMLQAGFQFGYVRANYRQPKQNT